MQAVFLQVLQQRAAGRMHDAFGNAGRARREEDVERVAEGELREDKRPCLVGRRQRVERAPVRQRGRERLGIAGIVHHDDRGAELAGDGLHLGRDVLKLAGIPVGVAGDEEPGFDLAEAVEHALFAEIGRAGGPDGAERGDGEHAGDGLRHVRHHGGDAIALADAERGEGLLEFRDARAQLVPGPAVGYLVLAAEDDGVAGTGLLQEVFREVQPSLGEETRLQHAVAVLERHRALLADRAAFVPHRAPERSPVLHRPGVQRVVGRKIPSGGPAGRLHEQGHRTCRENCGRGFPQGHF